VAHSAAPAGPSGLSDARILAFASSGVPTAMMGLMISTYMPRFYAGHIGIPLIAVGAAFTLVRLIDIPFDPIIGAVMDKTRTRFGRYRLWMLLGTPLLMLSLGALFMPPQDAGREYLIVWLLVYYAGASMFVLGHAAWAAALASSYHERSRIFGWMQGVGVFGSVSLLLLPILTGGAITPGEGESMKAIGWIVIVALPITAGIVAIFTPEKLTSDVRHEPLSLKEMARVIVRPSMLRLILADLCLVLGPGMTSPIYIFFFKDAKGFAVKEISLLLIPYIGAGVFGALVWSLVARRFGKHRTLQAACVAYAIAQTTLMALPRVWPHHTFLDTVPTIIGMFGVGFCASAFVLLIRAMVADAADELRLEQGLERSGLLYAMVTSTQKVGQALTVSVAFTVLAMVGYEAKDAAHNTVEAINGLKLVYLFAPVVFVLIGGACFFGYRLDAQRHSEIRSALEERDNALAAATAAEPLSELGVAASPAE
jgi:Na+/melibiose symporter-like transporter